MNKRIITFAMLGVLSLTTFGVAFHSFKQENNQKYALVSAEDYYASITDSMSGTTLLNNLHSIINNSGVKQSYDWSRYEAADEDPSNENNVILIYTRASDAKTNHVHGSLGWNREHTFPQSKMDGGNGAKSDNHIIFASDNKVNGARGNLIMGVVNNGTVVKDYNGKDTTCQKTSNMFDPHNVARGIVARTTMYAAAMYNYDPEDNFESIETLLSWHFEYPASEDDMRRNEIVYGNQNNRNPFVDHPEYACRIWGNKSSTTKSICSSYILKDIKIMSEGKQASDTTIDNGSSKTFEVYVDDAAVTNVTWSLVNSTDDPYINDKITLSVSEGKATVTAVSADTAYLKASYSYDVNGTTKTVTSKIKITSVQPIVLESITVDNPKTEYLIGDEFVTPDVTAHYSDDSTQNVKELASFSGFDSVSAGTKTITVTYLDKSTTYNVTVSLPAPVLNNITVGNLKTNYTIGDEFVKPVVTANYSDGSSKDVTNEASFSGFDSTTEGIKTIVVTYQDKTTTYDIVVSKGSYGPVTPTNSNGCGGNVATASIVLSSLAALGIIAIVTSKIIRKKKKMG